MQACAEYAKAAQTQGKKWQKAIQFEKDQRIKLEKMVEELAQQHRKLEEAAAASAHQQQQGGKIYLALDTFNMTIYKLTTNCSNRNK